MLGVISSNGDMMPPVCFLMGFQLTVVEYVDVLVTKVKPSIDTCMGIDECIPKENGTAAATASSAKNGLTLNLSSWDRKSWPPSTPDLNSLDYSTACCHVESEACLICHSSVETMKSSVHQAGAGLDVEARSCSQEEVEGISQRRRWIY